MQINWKDVLGDAYKDGMTVEEINTALENNDDYTFDKSENVISTSILSEKYVPKTMFDKTASDLAANRKRARELTEKSSNKEVEHSTEVAELQTQVAELTKQMKTAKFEKQFISQGYSTELASKAAAAMLDNDMDAFLAVQTDYVKSLNDKKDIEKLEDVKKPSGDPKHKDAPAMTRDAFNALPITRQQELYASDPSTYETLVNGE